MNRLITIGSMLILGTATAACNMAKSPEAVQTDVSKAEADRTENVANARTDGAKAIELEQIEVTAEQRDVTAERRDLNAATATRDYEVAVAKAEGDYQVATKACEIQSGSAQTGCKEKADAARESDKARAELLKPKG
jgi:hypothetical protein